MASALLGLVPDSSTAISAERRKQSVPDFIESILRASPFVAEAIVLGHGRKYLTALIEIDFDTVAEWARSNDVAYTGFTSLAQNTRCASTFARSEHIDFAR